MRKRLINLVPIALFVMVSLFGCAHKGPILIDFRYQAPQGAAEKISKTTVAVSPFIDERRGNNSVVGKRVSTLNDEANDLVVQGLVSEKVTAALKSALTARSITIHDVPVWDQTEAGIPASGTNLLIGGQIKALWIDCESQLASTTVKADVELRIVVADAAQKRIIKALNVNSKIEHQSIGYSTEFVEDTLAEALSSAIDQLFADDELKNRLM
jgi:hypothetical protein